jgi:hypothetical protein
MQPLDVALDLPVLLASRGVNLASLGVAYLLMLATAAVAFAAFLAARAYLVISPNRAARDYGTYVTVTLATLLIAMGLENELLPHDAITLQYVAVPELLILIAIHFAISRRQEPWLIALGGASVAGAIAVTGIAGLATTFVRPAHWITLLLLAGLLAFLWFRSVSTKRGFMSAKSIYVGSKETLDAEFVPQKPWLGLPQWVAFVGASIALAVANSLLRGSGLEQIPALDVAFESVLIVAITALVCAVPAASYWLARKAWMPELTRFAWLVWLVVSFAFTYGNYLSTLNKV